MIKERLIGYIEQSIIKNWDIEALSNYKGKGFTYKEIAEHILKLHIFFRETGIKEGDKIALVGRNSANWCMIYLATVTYGAVIVPILPDFKPDDLINLINHSDSMILFVDDKLAVISYTGGTTGFSKGVMISHNSLAANVRFAQNNMDYIAESLVIREDNKLIGLICPDFEMMKRDNITEDQLPSILGKIRKDVNERIPEYMVVNK